MGGAKNVSARTGSKCFERFTIHQIIKVCLWCHHQHCKVFRETPEAVANTERISLVSSFLTSLLVGTYAPIDPADGSGMNAMDINTKKWVGFHSCNIHS